MRRKIHHKNRKSFCHIACDSPDKPCPRSVYSARRCQMLCLAFRLDFQLFWSSIIVTIFSNRVAPDTASDYDFQLSFLQNGCLHIRTDLSSSYRRDSPVKDAWFTIPSPQDTSFIKWDYIAHVYDHSVTRQNIGCRNKNFCSSLFSHTFFMFKDMLRARSPTDFLCVHSSSNSPIPSRNMAEPVLCKSPRSTDTPIAVASTGTLSSVWPDIESFSDILDHFKSKPYFSHRIGKSNFPP